MIAYVKGLLHSQSKTSCVVDVNGVGYEVSVPSSDLAKLPKTGEPILLHTWHVQREDAQLLYGFLKESDRRLFKILLGVANVGPKSALAVLSGLSQPQLEDIVARQDAAMMAKIPGIGKKTAERLVLELKDKLEIDHTNRGAYPVVDRDAFAEALEALQALGYSATQARNAMQQVMDQDIPAETPGADRVAAFVKSALKHL